MGGKKKRRKERESRRKERDRGEKMLERKYRTKLKEKTTKE